MNKKFAGGQTIFARNSSFYKNLQMNKAIIFFKGLIVRIYEELRWGVRVIFASADRFYWDNGFSKAAALAYTTLFSLVPITALIVGILASFAASDNILPEAQSYLFEHFVPDKSVAEEASRWVRERADGLIGNLNAMMIAFSLVTALLLINSVEYVLNETWQVYESRSIAQRIAIFCAILVIAPILVLSGFYFIDTRIDPLIDQFKLNRYYISMQKNIVPFVIDYLVFLFLYYLVPKAPVRLRSALFGAGLSALLFAFAKIGFAIYVGKYASYKSIYADVSTIAIFLFWLYCAWVILLLGAEACFQAQYLPRQGQVWTRSVMSVGDARMVLGFQALVLICRAFRNGTKMPDDLDLAESLGCSSVVLRPTLNSLEKAGIISRGDSRDMPLTLMRAASKISLEDIQIALFGKRKSMRFAGEIAGVFNEFCKGKDPALVNLGDIIGISKDDED